MITNKVLWKMEKGRWKMIISIYMFLSLPGFSQNSQITWSSFNGGFGVSNFGNTEVISSAGIPFAGSSANGSSSIISGFLTNYSLLITDIEDVLEVIPTVYELNQNYPNPFNPSTIINYQIPEEGFVTLKVFDILGNEISTLVNEQKAQGSYKINFDARKLASGVYIYQIKAGAFVETKKMLLLR